MTENGTTAILAAIARLQAVVVRLSEDQKLQSQRLLNEIGALRDDMNVVIARLDRVDATAHGAVIESRTLHNQLTRVAKRLPELGAAP